MTEPVTAEGGREWVHTPTESQLEPRLRRALRLARRTGSPTLASVTSPVEEVIDPTAVVVASRLPGEPWFSLEQPERGAWALATLGAARMLEARGPERFKETALAWHKLAANCSAGPPPRAAGAGLVAVGGFAFAAQGGEATQWDGFAPASLVVPEVSLARSDGQSWLTLNVAVAPDDTVEGMLESAVKRLRTLRKKALPLLDPDLSGRYQVVSAMPPAHYEQAVAQAVQRIRAGELEKVVLAREVEVHAPIEHDPGAVIGVLREAFPSCYVFAVGRGDATFVAASPELLVRREGQRASTVALAGSTRRSADPAVDDHLGEQLLQSEKDREENLIVARRIATALKPYAVWVTVAPELAVVRVANIQHLASPIRAQLASPIDAIELAGLLHPTPAVGGEPPERAVAMIPALEGFDRGWYAGPVGWTDATGDGEFCVALRCALLRGRLAHCYAGGGIVRESDPAAELAETEIKLGAMLPVLAG